MELHVVRKRKWSRVRKLQVDGPKMESVKNTSVRPVDPSNSPLVSARQAPECPSQAEELEDSSREENNDDEKYAFDELTDEHAITAEQVQIRENEKKSYIINLYNKPPFEIDVCWSYSLICQSHPKTEEKGKEGEAENETENKTNGLSLWCPDLSEKATKHTTFSQHRWHFFGHVRHDFHVNPNGNIPCLIVQNGADSNALAAPKRFTLCNMYSMCVCVFYSLQSLIGTYICNNNNKRDAKKKKKKTPLPTIKQQSSLSLVHDEKISSSGLAYRYWFEVVPPKGYEALGSVVVELKSPIPEDRLTDHALKYLSEQASTKHLVSKLACLREEYVQRQYPYVSCETVNEDSNVCVLRPQPQLVSGVPVLVEMAMSVRVMKSASTWQSGKGLSMDHMNKADIMRLCRIPLVVDSPLIVSKATVFRCVWSSHTIGDMSNNRCSVWEPVLGPDEYTVGHLAIGEWQYPSIHGYKLLVLKTGGADPYAFKQPLAFECIWSVHKPGWNNKNASRSKVASLWSLIPTSNCYFINIYIYITDCRRRLYPNMFASKKNMCQKSRLSQKRIRVAQPANPRDGIVFHFLRSLKVNLFGYYLLLLLLLLLFVIHIERNGEEELIIRNRDEIWPTGTGKPTELQGKIFSPQSLTNEIYCPMLCIGLIPLDTANVLPTLHIDFCTQTDASVEIVKKGYLSKKGKESFSKMQKRYCVLTTNKELSYYQGAECKNTILINDLKDVKIVDNDKAQKFNMIFSNRTYHFETENSDALEWVNAIQKVRSSETDSKNTNPLVDEALILKGQPSSTQSTLANAKSLSAMEEKRINEANTDDDLVCALLQSNLDKLKRHFSQIRTTSSFDHSFKAIQWYEELDILFTIIQTLFARWSSASVCPSNVLALKESEHLLTKEAETIITNDIMNYIAKDITENIALRLHWACLALSHYTQISTNIADQLVQYMHICIFCEI
ncbi:hypothetical protein RFI_15340, partial [Reticulomyxa filosa]